MCETTCMFFQPYKEAGAVEFTPLPQPYQNVCIRFGIGGLVGWLVWWLVGSFVQGSPFCSLFVCSSSLSDTQGFNLFCHKSLCRHT